MSITDQLREQTLATGLTQTEIAAATGLQQSVISHFIRGGGLKSKSTDAIAAWLGVRVTKSRKVG
jgi:predicted XRE-type DNA-binding protein